MQNLHWLGLRLVLLVIFRCLLPLAARLPRRWGVKVSAVVGWACYHLDLDWRTLGLREHFLIARTRSAINEIEPALSDSAVNAIVLERFKTASREELEGHWLGLQRWGSCRCDFEGLQSIQDQLTGGQGLVLLTMHFDAALVGVAQLGLAGCVLNLMTSNVVEDHRVPVCVQRYFSQKYAGIQIALNGGKVMHVENKLRHFYEALKRGEGVVILGEAPTGRIADAKIINFLGKRRAIAPGAFRMAEKTGSAMAAFVCLRSDCGDYKVIFTPVFAAHALKGHSENTDRLFSFLSERIKQYPGRWWAADQLPNFFNVDN